MTYSSSHQLINRSLIFIITEDYIVPIIELQVYDLVFDHQYHGRNIKIEDGGRAAQKMKK